MASPLRRRWASLAFLFIITMATDAAPCGRIICPSSSKLDRGNSSAASSKRPSISSSLQARQHRKHNMSVNGELGNVELVVVQKLFNAIQENADERPVKDPRRPQRCGKRCRRRRRHNQRLKSGNVSLRSIRHRTDPNILKSNKAPVVITQNGNILRQDWCKTEPLKQTIRLPGCRPKTVMNNFCYGQCNSFFIPNSAVSDDAVSDRDANSSVTPFKSCAVCKPRLTSWVSVTLRCPGMIPPTRTKKILRVHKCRCQAEAGK